MMLSYMEMEERSDVFFPGDHYYYFSYEGAPQIISGYDVDYDVMGDRHGKMPYSTGMGRMPCVMAHITTGADAKIIGMEFFTYAGFMHWDKWTGNATDTGDTGFTSYEEVLNYYREVLPNIKKDKEESHDTDHLQNI